MDWFWNPQILYNIKTPRINKSLIFTHVFNALEF